MPDSHDHSVTLMVIDKDGEEVLAHTSHQHSRDGACTAYGHALVGLMKHYRDQRQLLKENSSSDKAPRKVPAKLAATMPEDPDRAS